MMDLIPIKDIIKVRERPESTISLIRAVKEPIKTISTYVFTNSIKRNFEQILDSFTMGNGGGFWITAEYGAGKTHFLSALTILLSTNDETVWNEVRDNEIKEYRKRLLNNKLFPIVFSLKGESSVDLLDDNLLTVIEKNIEDALIRAGYREKVSVNTTDEVINWYHTLSQSYQITINDFIRQNTGKTFSELDKNSLSELILEFCNINHTRPQLNTSTKARISNIYDQLIQNGFNGILFVIDEFGDWQRRHPKGTDGYSRDQDVLETLSWVLPKDLNKNIYIIIASAEPNLIKLKGERFKEFALFSGKDEREFDIIVSKRIRDICDDKLDEINKYYNYYFNEYKFLKFVNNKSYFYDTFPYQPKLFEAARKITMKTGTTRAGINYIYEVTHNDDVLSKNSLIIVSDLFDSTSVDKDLKQYFKDSYLSFENLKNNSKDINFEIDDYYKISDKLIKTLYLWQVAYSDSIKTLSTDDIADMILVPSDTIKGSDHVDRVLNKLRGLPQINYTEKGAYFKITDTVEKSRDLYGILNEYKQKVSDSSLLDYWENCLLTPINEYGELGLFGEMGSFKTEIYYSDFRKIEYPGEVILTNECYAESFEKLRNDIHFRIIFITKNINVDTTKIKDSRIAICIPSTLSEPVKEYLRIYVALTKMEDQYKGKKGIDAENDKLWIKSQKKEAFHNIICKQLDHYQNGKIYTKNSISLDEKKIFVENFENTIDNIVTLLLNNSYTSSVFIEDLTRKLSSSDVKKIYEGLFKKSDKPAAISACKNYAISLGLSNVEDSAKFSPAENTVFNYISDKLSDNEGEYLVSKIYNELADCPYGLLNELTTLYLLSYVRWNANIIIKLKPGSLSSSIKSNKLNSNKIPDLTWKNKMENEFDTIESTTVKTWGDVLPYAKVINNNLIDMKNPEDNHNQEQLLIKCLNEINNKKSLQIDNIKPLYNKFNENLGNIISIIENIYHISGSIDYLTFYDRLKDIYPDGETPNLLKFKEEYKIFMDLDTIYNKAPYLISVKEYLTQITLPEVHELTPLRLSLLEKVKISSLIDNIGLLNNISSEFEVFKTKYVDIYTLHHNSYYRELVALNTNLNSIKKYLDTIRLLNLIGINSSSTIFKEFETLSNQMVTCPDKDSLNLDSKPVCQRCSLTLDNTPPIERVANFIGQCELYVKTGMNKLSQIVTPIIDYDTDNKLKMLIMAMNQQNVYNFTQILNNDIIIYIKSLLEKANIQPVQTEILKSIISEYPYLENDQVDKFITDLKSKIQSEFTQARHNYPNKKIRIELKLN